MSVDCSCMTGDFEWYYIPDEKCTPLNTIRRRRCEGCGELISVGDATLKLNRYRPPHTYVEERIHGEEVPLANKYFCEECSDLYYSIIETGACVSLDGIPLKVMWQNYLEEKE